MTAIVTQSIDSQLCALSVNSQDISVAIIKVTFPASWVANDITAFGSTGRRYAHGIDESRMTIEAMFNQVTTTGSNTVLSAAWSSASSVAFAFYPAGNTTGNTKVIGNLWVQKYEIVSQVGTFVKVTAECLVDNGATISTV